MHNTTSEEAIFAGGCFWGIEYLFKKLPGIINTQVGYTGGLTNSPRYDQVCGGSTGHVEAIKIVYDPSKINYEQLARYFFEIHDPTQKSGQGPDIGEQYLSRIFYGDEQQKKIADALISELKRNGYEVATKVCEATTFWPAEDYHQDYYNKTGKQPYCHRYIKRFS